MKHLIAPSILSANFAYLREDIEMVNLSNADWFHVDIMDGRFVPNISFGFPVMEALKKYAQKMLDVHLMIVEPENYIPAFAKAGANLLTIHYEAVTHLHKSIQEIKKNGMKAGVALNPHTPVHVLEDIIHELDLVLIMSVNPGFGGQEFIERSYAKIEKLTAMTKNMEKKPLIEVDGGISEKNAKQLIQAGANVLVAGNAVFKAANPTEMITKLKEIC
jgi:ribulose-phosphate 3-epimerase